VLAQLIIEQRLGFLFVAMPLYFSGAGSQSKLQSKPIRWLFLDEVRNYPPGALETVLKRTRSFWNSKRLIISTPDMENDAVDRAFKAGDQRVFHFSCPSCRHLQPLTFEQLKWDTNDLTKPSGAWDFDALAATIRYVCVSCGHVIRDTPQARKLIARTGQFVRLNMRAPHHRVSFHWNALLPPWVSWRSLVEEFLQARAAARNGDIKPLKTFVNESLGESWKDQLGVIDEFDFLLDRRANYVFGDPWPEEEVRFLSADRQAAGGEHYWFVVRAFARGGRSRLIAYGRCNSLMDLEETRKRHNVHAVNSVIDSGYRASEVYRFCRGTGWKPFKGEGDDFFLHKDPVSKKTVRRVWETSLVDPAYGTRLQGRVRPIKLWRWSNPGIKDLLFEQMTGVIGEWTIPSEVGRDYLQQLSAENRVEERDARGYVRYRWHQKRRDNHLLDCELQIAVVAVVTGMIASSGSRRTFDTPPGVNGAVEPENVPGVSPAESAGGWDYSQGGS
jgi:phage terminase large subunit GpA-like protein